jgi:RHS repeat-associated protein
VAGAVTRPATSATVNGQGATLYADQTYASSIGHTLSNGTNTFTVIAQSTTGAWATNTLNAYLPDPLAFTNDANGNLTNDGVRCFQYDAENQLTNAYVPNAWRSEFKYDGLNRRRIRKEYTWTGNDWSLTNETRYVFDGLLVLQERDGNNIPVLTYTRGLDLSGSLQGAGGIGGLLALSDQRADARNPTNYYYHADGNGNITALLNQRNEIVARYLYDPFGNLLSKSGPMADFNRMRFSSKEVHLQSGLYYYGLRYYGPNFQRWLNQDPIGEAGGINLYRFVRNAPLNRIDPIGLDDTARGTLLDELGETQTQKNAKKWKEDFLDTAKTGLELLPHNDFSEAVLGESLGGEKLSGTEQAGAAAGLFAGLFGKAKKCATAAKDWWKARKAKKAADAFEKGLRDAIDGARKGCKDCEEATEALSKLLPGGEKVRFGDGMLHEAYAYEGRILDPTAGQYLEKQVVDADTLANLGLSDAVKSGVFSSEQHNAFIDAVRKGLNQ